MNSYATPRYAVGGRNTFPAAHVPFPITTNSSKVRGQSSLSMTTPVVANPASLLDRQEAAAYLRLKPQTLANWVVTRAQSLPYVKIGRRVMYRLADLDAFVLANRRAAAGVAA